ncbi:hypothetical protein GCM10022384_07530 [Streptomyces marokkonensis]|uniref:Uncharacterized protein n=1 Tax=Streptomyces marokkonensis TaxID=324855 RepID=A0ABP7NYV7_9ACTN
MGELVQWLRAQLDEDERTARAASWTDDANVWHAEPSPFDTRGAGQRWYVEDAMEDGVVSHVDPRASDDEGVARHVAEWDPARVLREIDAKRQMLDLHRPVHRRSTGSGGETIEDCQVCGHFPAQYPCATLRILALPYADRPGYRMEWRP